MTASMGFGVTRYAKQLRLTIQNLRQAFGLTSNTTRCWETYLGCRATPWSCSLPSLATATANTLFPEMWLPQSQRLPPRQFMVSSKLTSAAAWSVDTAIHMSLLGQPPRT